MPQWVSQKRNRGGDSWAGDLLREALRRNYKNRVRNSVGWRGKPGEDVISEVSPLPEPAGSSGV